MSEYNQLWQAIRGALERPPDDHFSAIEALPEVGCLPSPWATWTLFGLVRHRRRQLWVAGIVVSKLGGDPEALAVMGAFGHPPEVPQQGLVPGLTEWEYLFHGKGCCLTHRGTGEAIDVDFFGPDGEYFDLFFYQNYLRSLRAPEPPEARLIALHRSIDPIRLAVRALLEAGMLCPLEGRDEHPFRVAEHVLDHEDAIDAFCEAWGSPDRRLWLAAAIGDWLASHEAVSDGGDRELIDLTSSRAEAFRAIRCRALRDGWLDEGRRGDILLALDDLDAEALAEWLGKTLRGPIGGVTSKAVQIIRRHDDPAWCPAIHQLFRRLDPKGSLPQPYLWAECQRFLLRQGYLADEMKKSLTRANGVALGEAGLLALEHDPASALPLFRRALRSPIPMNREVAAATLALIDRPWSRREMIAVLTESDDQEATAECRAALMECHDGEAHRAVLEWEAAHPHEPESGPWITMGEMMLIHRPESVRWQMEELHERAMRVRSVEPGDARPNRPGWLDRIVGWLRSRS